MSMKGSSPPRLLTRVLEGGRRGRGERGKKQTTKKAAPTHGTHTYTHTHTHAGLQVHTRISEVRATTPPTMQRQTGQGGENVGKGEKGKGWEEEVVHDSD